MDWPISAALDRVVPGGPPAPLTVATASPPTENGAAMSEFDLGPDIVARVREATDLVEVVSDHVRLQRRGRSWEGLCPFHDEKTPSFSVDPERGLYYCFGCHQGGDSIRFVMETERLSFPEAVEWLARRFGVELPLADPAARRRRQDSDRLRSLLEEAQHWFESRLQGADGGPARRELERRGFDRETWREFGFGVAPETWRALLEDLGRRHPSSALVRAGLAVEPERGGEPYDRFRGRLMFPIRAADGRLVAFGGRVLGDGEPKYLNSPESELFHKRSTLFALDRARRPLADQGVALVVEGYFDCLSLHRVGVATAVATLGTALTSDHARLLRRRLGESGRVVLCYDADAAGRRAAVAGAQVVLAAGLTVEVLELPEGNDPDDIVRSGGLAAFEECLAHRRPLLDHLLAGLPAAPAERRSAGLALVPMVAAATDPATRRSMLEQLAREIDLPLASLVEQADRAGRRGGRPEAAPATTVPASAMPAGESRLVHALLYGDAALRRRVLELIDTDDLHDARARSLVAHVASLPEAVREQREQVTSSLLEQAELAGIVAEVSARGLPELEAERLESQLHQLERRRARRTLKQRTRALMAAERAGTPEEAARLVAEQRDQLRDRSKPE